jgi:CHAT domain-containing protein/Tfp pilus assembly protein PilF
MNAYKTIFIFLLILNTYTYAQSDTWGYYLNQAKNYESKGEYDKAIENYNKAQSLNPAYNYIYYFRGEAYFHNGEYENAIRDFSKALDFFPDSSEIYFSRGNAYFYLKNYEEAIENYNVALEISPYNVLAYINNGISYHIAKNYPKAIENFTKALEIEESGETYFLRADAYRGNKEFDKEFDDYEKGLLLAESDPNYYKMIDLVWSMTNRISKSLNNESITIIDTNGMRYFDLVRRSIDKAVQKAEYMRSNFGSRGADAMLKMIDLYYMGVYLNCYFRNTYYYEDTLYNRTAPPYLLGQSEYASRAFEYSEALRSRSFLEQLGKETALNIPGIDPQDKTEVRELITIIEQQQKILSGDDDRTAGEAGSRMDKAEQELKRIENKITQKHSLYTELSNPKPVSIDDALSWCKNDQVILEYVIWQNSADSKTSENHPANNAVCLVLTKDGVSSVQLSQSFDYTKSINELRRKITELDTKTKRLKYNESDFEKERNELYVKLIKPLVEKNLIPASVKNILIVPDGALMYLPFDVLRETKNSANFGESYALSMSPSVSVSMLSRKETNPAIQPLLAFGNAWYNNAGLSITRGEQGLTVSPLEFSKANSNVVFDDGDGNIGKYLQKKLGKTNIWMDLNGTRLEIERIQSLVKNSSIYMGKEASEANIKKMSSNNELKKYPIIHFSCHGYYDEKIPAYSSIVFSEVSERLPDNGEDGYLSVPEIAILNLNAKIVILSACETVLAQVNRGEGMVGLTRSFLVAGAENVGVSLWSISDAATVDFMGVVYQKVVEQGKSFREAYWETKKDFAGNKNYAQWSHPYFWAAFVLYD